LLQRRSLRRALLHGVLVRGGRELRADLGVAPEDGVRGLADVRRLLADVAQERARVLAERRGFTLRLAVTAS
jgi:hypothetical protein